MTIRINLRNAAAMLLLTAPFAAQAASHLRVSLTRESGLTQGGTAIVTVTMTNDGDEPGYVYRPESPFGRTDDEPASDFLEVKDSSGNLVPYIGSRGHWGPMEIDHFLAIAPGQSVTKRVDIARSYAFGPGGVFTVRYATIQRMPPIPELHRHRTTHERLESSELVITVDRPSERHQVH
ncbi:MAG: hypothetical protein WBW32_11675 [Luteibacter sp.]